MANTDTTTLPLISAPPLLCAGNMKRTKSTHSSRKPKASPWWAASSLNNRGAELIGGGLCLARDRDVDVRRRASGSQQWWTCFGGKGPLDRRGGRDGDGGGSGGWREGACKRRDV